jgi:hypothetical protein
MDTLTMSATACDAAAQLMMAVVSVVRRQGRATHPVVLRFRIFSDS